MAEVRTWGEVIASLDTLGPDDIVCFSNGPSSPTEPCLIADSSELAPEADVPPAAITRGWHTVLGRDEIRGVLTNLSHQRRAPDVALILRAIAHYTDNDAYLQVP